ncbi:hypothetical protein BX666DRAFT_1631632 [Dichotomocladium elegans]|nr:hypothetical protein BX666DRAFT_1631632 [Dichotomocladium elegans]
MCRVYRQGDYCPPEKSARQSTFMVEMAQLHGIYENMVLTSAKFPSANQVNKTVLDYTDLVAEIVGIAPWPLADLRNFAEALNSAAQKTFNSPRITRHLFNVLVKAGEFQEARYALQAYMSMIGLVTHFTNETKAHGAAFATNSRGTSIPIPIINTKDIKRMVQESGYSSRSNEDDDGEDTAKPSNPAPSRIRMEKESAEDILQVLLSAIKLFCEETEEGVEAVEIAEIAKTMFGLQDERFKQKSKDLGARLYRAAGAAYGLLASQTADPVTRSAYHKQAGKLLQQSLDLDPNAWQTYYQLALEHAETRDIHQAVQAVTKSLQLNPDHVPSWHLLVLACSCPIQGDLEQALKASQMCLERIQWESKEDSQEEAGGDTEDVGVWPGFERNEQRILLQMTQLMLLNLARGPESALELQKELFGSYSKSISAYEEIEYSAGQYQDDSSTRNPVVLSGSLNNLSDSTEMNSRSSVLARNPNGSASSTTSDDSLRIAPHFEMTLQHPHHRRLHPSLHLFRSRSNRKSRQALELGNRSYGSLKTQASAATRASIPMQASVTSLQSTVPSLSSTRSIVQKPTNLSANARPTERFRLRRRRSTRILCNLWLLSANSYLELDLTDEALKAIEEAENVDWTENAGVWCALGRLRLAEGQIDGAITAFQKGLVCEEHSVECRVWLARAYIQHGDLEVAEGHLEFATRGFGWNNAEAW